MESDLLKILIERTSYINTYWNFYIVIATAIIGIISSGKIEITKSIRRLLAVAFVLFAVSNLHGIMSVNDQRTALVTLITSAELTQLISTLKPNDYWQYYLFHLLLDASVLFAIFRIKATK